MARLVLSKYCFIDIDQKSIILQREVIYIVFRMKKQVKVHQEMKTLHEIYKHTFYFKKL